MRARSAGRPDIAEQLLTPWRELAGDRLRLEAVHLGLEGTAAGSLRTAHSGPRHPRCPRGTASTIFGVDMAVAPLTAPDPATWRPRTPARGGAHVLEPPLRVTLLAQNLTGWARLCRLVSVLACFFADVWHPSPAGSHGALPWRFKRAREQRPGFTYSHTRAIAGLWWIPGEVTGQGRVTRGSGGVGRWIYSSACRLRLLGPLRRIPPPPPCPARRRTRSSGLAVATNSEWLTRAARSAARSGSVRTTAGASRARSASPRPPGDQPRYLRTCATARK